MEEVAREKEEMKQQQQAQQAPMSYEA